MTVFEDKLLTEIQLQIGMEDYRFYTQVNVLITLAEIPHVSGAILLYRSKLESTMETLKNDSMKCMLAYLLGSLFVYTRFYRIMLMKQF